MTAKRAPRRILVDATELVQNPVRTGIQRVVRALLETWPDQDELVLCRYDLERGLVALAPEAIGLLTVRETAGGGASPAEMAREIAGLRGREAPIPEELPILVPEVFYDFPRCAHHTWLLSHDPYRTSFIAFDFIPWLHPEAIGVRTSADLMHYVKLLRDARRVGFISRQTRDDYTSRVVRNGSAGGPVFSLGADGPGIPRQKWSNKRDTFLCVGSVDGRKNQEMVLDAFERLWQAGAKVRLAMVGRVFEGRQVQGLRDRIEGLSGHALFTHHADIDDAAFAGLYGRARATIYASELEGYGLPPVESLHCGVPVIAAAALPSLADIPANGQWRLERMTVDAIQQAVTALSDNDVARTAWSGVAGVPTARWRDMSAAVAEWVRGSGRGTRQARPGRIR